MIIAVYTKRQTIDSPSRLLFPAALQEIEEEAFVNVDVQIVDLRGTQVSSIATRAFADNSHLREVYIPSGVRAISDTAFAGCSDFVIHCVKDSYADNWARRLGYPVAYDVN